MEILYKKLSDQVVAAAAEVHRNLGHGFLESVYGKALAYELDLRGVHFEKEVLLPVNYKGKPIGKYKADFVVDEKIISAGIMHRLSSRSAAGGAMTRRARGTRLRVEPRRRTHTVRRGVQGVPAWRVAQRRQRG